MHLGTVPFAKATHHGAILLMYLLSTKRATLVKQPYEKIQQHVRNPPIQAPQGAHAAPQLMPNRWRVATRSPGFAEQKGCQLPMMTQNPRPDGDQRRRSAEKSLSQSVQGHTAANRCLRMG
jgi:hypothetical protein